jgi:glycosidase
MEKNTMTHWAFDSIFYHIYPLGLCDAPAVNDFHSPAEPRLGKVFEWLDHIQGLGVNALYLGPLFESTRHGYDTADYFWVDRRLGDNALLKELVRVCHERGMRVILDGVFNHVGRDFWAFRDVLEKGQSSAYCNWFAGLSFNGRSPHNDPFTYEGWSGHYDLVKLNLYNPDVVAHLLLAVEMWIKDFGIDGLRLDAADVVEHGFLRQLAAFTKSLRPDFWLVGEVVHGDYNKWANPEMLDAVTNYECYKGLYSSHADKNYFEIAYALQREFGEQGLYRGLPLYNFVDNHDVDRVASNLTNPAHLYPLYGLLFTMPGVPSIYYGSEWGLEGKRRGGDDRPLRPALDLNSARENAPHPELAEVIARLAQVRYGSDALRHGDYHQLLVQSEQFAFMRRSGGERVVVLVNAADTAAAVELNLPEVNGGQLGDLLDTGETIHIHSSGKVPVNVWPHWLRILQIQ